MKNLNMKNKITLILLIATVLGSTFVFAKPYRKYKWRCKISLGWSNGPRINVGCSEVLREPKYTSHNGGGTSTGPKGNVAAHVRLKTHNSVLTTVAQIQNHPYLTSGQKAQAIKMLHQNKKQKSIKKQPSLN